MAGCEKTQADKDERCSLVQAFLGSGPPGFNTGRSEAYWDGW